MTVRTHQGLDAVRQARDRDWTGHRPRYSPPSTGELLSFYDFGHDHGAADPPAYDGDWDWSKIPSRQPSRPIAPRE